MFFLCLLGAFAHADQPATSSKSIERSMLQQYLPVGAVITDRIDTLGTCELQMPLVSFGSIASLDAIEASLRARLHQSTPVRTLISRQQDVLWASWQQDNLILTLVVRPEAATVMSGTHAWLSRGFLLISGFNDPAIAAVQSLAGRTPMTESRRRLSLVPASVPMALSSDHQFQRLIQQGRQVCSRDASHSHWTLVAQSPLSFDEARRHFGGLLAGSNAGYRPLVAGGSANSVVMISRNDGQLLFGVHAAGRGTAIVVHSIMRMAASGEPLRAPPGD